MATKHTHESNFGRKVAGCPRCDELLAGAEPVRGYGSMYSFTHGRYITKAEEIAQRLTAIRNHDCKASGCSTICCTANEW
jgi:hypothetical protein